MDEKKRISAASTHAHNADSLMGPRFNAAYEGFLAGSGWALSKFRDEQAVSASTASDLDEIRDALGTIGEGIATLLANHRDLAAAGLRGSDRGVAILKHLQEIGDNVRGVGGAIGDKFGVVLDAIKHVGETTEAVLDQVTAIDVVNIEVAREEPEDAYPVTTEPMHIDVKAAPTDASGLGRLWADVTVQLEDVSDETLRDLWRSEQIPTSRYMEETIRRDGIKDKLDPGYGPHVDTDKISIGEPFEVADLRNQLRIAKTLEAFWRKTAATRGERIKAIGEQVMDMGEMVDSLTGRITGA